jgi:hypothetical protein
VFDPIWLRIPVNSAGDSGAMSARIPIEVGRDGVCPSAA